MQKIALAVLIGGFGSALSWAQTNHIPVRDWTVPLHRGGGVSEGLSPMTDISPGIGFVAIQPCRIVDTRGGGVFIGGYGPPSISAGQTRSFDLNSAPHCTGIPAGVDAYSLNFTVTQTAGAPGDIRAWPTGDPPVQLTSVLNWTAAAATLANATIIPAGSDGAIDVQVAGSGTHLLIDINGYFTDEYNPSTTFFARSFSTQPAVTALNSSSDPFAMAVRGVQSSPNPQTGAMGVEGVIFSTAPAHQTAGVRGINQGSGTNGIGVWGVHLADGWGVYGEAHAGIGVYGEAKHTSSPNSGVTGQSRSLLNNSAGVRGVNGGGPVPGSFTTAGVRGESAGVSFGVLGLATAGSGTGGFRINGSNGDIQSGGELGVSPTVGLSVFGNSQVTGTKAFIEPHPSDASKTIRYISLEGNEAGTYFRGKGRFQNGIAVIEVPEDFRIVTDAEGLSVQVTPIGQMATVAVESINLDRIVVRGSRNVEFFYTVNGVRHAYRNAGPIAEDDRSFSPRSRDEKMPEYLPEALRQRLISNGTYRPDGTVNLETARRLGWDKNWEERSGPAPQPEQP